MSVVEKVLYRLALIVLLLCGGCRAATVQEAFGDLPDVCDYKLLDYVLDWQSANCGQTNCGYIDSLTHREAWRFTDPRCLDALEGWAETLPGPERRSYLKWIASSHNNWDQCRQPASLPVCNEPMTRPPAGLIAAKRQKDNPP